MTVHSLFPPRPVPSTHTSIFPVLGEVTKIHPVVDPHVQEFFLLLFLLLSHPNHWQVLFAVLSHRLQVCPFSPPLPSLPSLSWTTEMASLLVSWLSLLCPLQSISPSPRPPATRVVFQNSNQVMSLLCLKHVTPPCLLLSRQLSQPVITSIICFLVCCLPPPTRI